MIERLVGPIVARDDKQMTVLAGGVGYAVHVAQSGRFAAQGDATVLIYAHWVQDKGLVLYGFESTLARELFCLIISCPKIGPAIALALLRQRKPAEIVRDIAAGNEAGLSGCTGVGPKKAQQIIHALKDKMGALVSENEELAGSSAADWQHVQDALGSLHYSRQEIADAIAYLNAEYREQQTPELNVLLRKALAYLSAPR